MMVRPLHDDEETHYSNIFQYRKQRACGRSTSPSVGNPPITRVSEWRQHPQAFTCDNMIAGLGPRERSHEDVPRKKDEPIPAPDLLTPDEAAKRLRVTAEQVRSLIRKGQLAAVNVGTGPKRPLYRISAKAMDEFLARRWQPGPAVRPKKFRRLPPVRDYFPNLR
jgi:excisionase family DNA binding protein